MGVKLCDKWELKVLELHFYEEGSKKMSQQVFTADHSLTLATLCSEPTHVESTQVYATCPTPVCITVA